MNYPQKYEREYKISKLLAMERLIEPLPMKAGDPRVIANGLPVKADFRIISEGNYQKMRKAYNEKCERWEKAQNESSGLHLQNVNKRFLSWSDILIGFIAGVFGTIIALAYIF